MQKELLKKQLHFFAELDAENLSDLFWDLETQAGLQRPESVFGILWCGLPVLELRSAKIQDVYRVVDTVLRELSFPVHYEGLVGLQLARRIRDLGSSTEFELSALSAFRLTNRIDLKQILDGLFDKSSIEGIWFDLYDFAWQLVDINSVENILEVPDLPLPLKALARHDLAFTSAFLSPFQNSWSNLLSKGLDYNKLHEAITAKDYRLFRLGGDRQDDAEYKLVYWFLTIAFPKHGAFRKAMAKPSTIGRSTDRNQLTSTETALLQLGMRLEQHTMGGAEPGVILGTNVMELIETVSRPILRCLAYLATTQICRRMHLDREVLLLEKNYQQYCSAISRGLNDDLLMVGETELVPTGLKKQNRGLFLARKAGRILMLTGLMKVRSWFSRQQADRAATGQLMSKLLKQDFEQLVQMRGAIQKVLQLGWVIRSRLPYEWRERLNQELDLEPTLTESQVEDLLSHHLVSWPECFESIDLRPFASGSVGQLHRALLADGSQVCVKVKYPDIKERVSQDFKVLKSLIPIVSIFLRNQNLYQILENWRRQVLGECSLIVEAANTEKVVDALQDFDVVLPKINRKYSNDHVLVTEFQPGLEFLEFVENSSQLERNSIGEMLWKTTYHLLSKGLFRGDIQPANYKVHEGKLVMLDFGFVEMGEDLDDMEYHLMFMHGIANQDVPLIAKLLVEYEWSPEYNEEPAEIICNMLGKPFRGVFKFDDEYVTDIYKMMTDRLAPMLKVPDGNAKSMRIYWSMFSMLALLGAEADWKEVLAHELECGRQRLDESA